jgi:hypothetical protein
MSTETIQLPRGHHAWHGPCWIPRTSREGKNLRPLVKCVCGELYGTEAHTIHADGTVTASWLSKNCCQWHVFLKLLDWPGDVFPPSP